MSNSTLYFFVDDFSGNEKEEFFEKELPYLCQAFKNVIIFSLTKQPADKLNYKAPNLTVELFDFFAPCNRIKVFIKNIHLIFLIFFYEIFKTHNKSFYLKNFKKNLNQLVLFFAAASRLEKVISNDINSTTVFYTYWFKQWAAALSIIKLKHPKLKFVSRIHGADYDEDQIKTVIPFRYFQLQKINKIFPVSDYARNYIIKKFGVNPNKVVTSRLGLTLNNSNTTVNANELVIVSCSSLIQLKRVHLIVDILKQIHIPCKWIHFGAGPLLEDIKKSALSLHHTIEFKGHVANSIFTNYLKTSPVSLFINVSESEGIPVTMMEAIANGIPLIGTSVCGVPEIVTEKTGFLFPVNFNPADVAHKIEELHKSKQIYMDSFRSGIINFYRENFLDQTNHTQLSHLLINV